MRLLSVTEVLSVYQDFSAITPERLATAANRGTEVHRICAAIARGLWWASGIPEDQRGYVKSFERWMDVAVAQVLLVEERLECKCHGFTGTPDLVVLLHGDNRAAVIDLKTPITEGPTWKSQCAAYNHLAHCAAKETVERSGALMLSPKGKMARLREYQRQAEDFAAFLAALTAYRYFKKG